MVVSKELTSTSSVPSMDLPRGNTPVPRVMYVSRHDPGFVANEQQQLNAMKQPILRPVSGATDRQSSTVTTMPPTPTLMFGRGSKKGELQRPRTADIKLSESLPSLGVPEDLLSSSMQRSNPSPYAEDLRHQRELAILRKRNRELESELKRATHALEKHRQMRAMQAAYGSDGTLPRHDEPPKADLSEKLKEAAHARREAEEALSKLQVRYEGKLKLHAAELAELNGRARTAEQEKEDLAKRERDERVELLRRQVGRRIMNQGITRGFTAWSEFWQAKVWAFARLRSVGNKLRSPEMSAAFDFWLASSDEARRAREDAEHQRSVGGMLGERQSLVEELEAMKKALMAADVEKTSALERLRIELSGNAEEIAAMAEEKAKEERIELLRRNAMRRMLNAGLANAWSAWTELWEAKLYAMARLRQVGNRLKSPELSAAFSFWAEDLAEVRLKAHLAQLAQQSMSQEAQLRQARFESNEKELLRIAQEDELRGLRERVGELHAEIRERGADKAAVEKMSAELEEIRAQARESDDAADLNERKRLEAEADVERQQAETQKMLERLLGEQRRAFDAELLRYRSGIEEEMAVKDKEARVEQLRRQIGRRIMNRGLTRGWMAWSEFWQAKVYAMARLRDCGNRLKSPELAQAFGVWLTDLQAAREMRLSMGGQKSMAKLTSQTQRVIELEGTLESLKVEFDAVVSDRQALRDKFSAIDGGVAEAKRALEEQAAKDKEERVELLRRQIGRRIMNQGITRGFTAWSEFWQAKVWAMNRLRSVGNKLRSPEMSNAFDEWRGSWHAEVEARLEEDNRAKGLALATTTSKMLELEETIAALRGELSKSAAEKETLRERVHQLDGGFSEAKQAMEEQAAKDKEERIELLRRQIGRRIMNQGITRGFTAWSEFWQAKVWAMNRLRSVGNKLKSPEISTAFDHWYGDLQAKKVRALSRGAAGLEGVAATLQAEVQELRYELETRLAAAAEDKRVALERQLVELTGSAESQAALRGAREREERIELLRRQVMRRMMNAGLAGAWQAWVEAWGAKVYAKSRLREVANRLKAPELSIAFSFWADDLAGVKAAAALAAAEAGEARLERERFELDSELQRVRSEYEFKLKGAEEQNANLLAKVVELGGGVAEADALLEQRRAKEKEERIELLRRQIARRMMNQGLVRGWTAWTDMWRARVGAMKMLRIVGNRFKAPAKSAAFEHWLDDLQSTKEAAARAARLAALKRSQGAIAGSAAQLQDEVEELKQAMKEQRAAAEADKEAALQRQLTELTGSADERRALADQAAKEERVELLRRQIGRRIMNQGITRGFTAWSEFWQAKVYAMGRLRECGNRLKSPELAQAFTFWADDLAEVKQKAELLRLERASKSLEVQLRQTRFENGQMDLNRVANEDELRSLRGNCKELGREIKEKDERLEQLRNVQKEHADLQETHKALVASEERARVKLAEAEEEAVRMRATDKELLEKLLGEQRKMFEEEQTAARANKKRWGEEARMREEEATRMAGELAKLKGDTEKLEAKLRDEMKTLKAEVARKKDWKPPPKKAEPPAPKGTGPLGHIDLDEGPDAPPISQQIATALKKNSTRVLDLFRSWDTDGDGEVTRSEFHAAMPRLGLEVPKKDIDDLFSQWDKGGDGALGLKELQRILGAAAVANKQSAGKIGASSPAQQSLATATAVSGAAGALLKLKNKNKASPLGKLAMSAAADIGARPSSGSSGG